MARGKLIVLEGIDGCGKHTQCSLLKGFLREKKRKFKVFAYPDLNGPLGKVISDFLNKKIDLDKETQFLLFAMNMMASQENVRRALLNCDVVILNRYVTSTLAYQCAFGGLERKIEFVRELGLAEPDMVVLLDISAETSMKRKYRQKKRNNGSLDRFEENKRFLKAVRNGYLELGTRKFMCRKWKVIDSEAAVEEVSKQIKKYISSLIK